MKLWKEKKRRWLLVVIIPLVLLFFYWLQHSFAHRDGTFAPDYPCINLTEQSDYETFFQQTGLGKPAIDKLIENGDFDKILKVQEAFFSEDEVECVSVFGWFTMSDRIDRESSAPLVDLRPGDILLSLSTHSMGWKHGHAGLVLDEESVLECKVLGQNSAIVHTKHWNTYSNYIVLRVKGVSEELQQDVVAYAKEHLCGVPYRLTAGLIGKKTPEPNEAQFGLHCAYLVWYAWQQFGYDLDSDGGRLVTAYDILQSDLLEVVQVYGMDPILFQTPTLSKRHIPTASFR